MCRLRRALLTLQAYPSGDQNIVRHKQQESAARLGLENAPATSPLGRRNPRATKAKVASRLLRTQPDWAIRVWGHLTAIGSPWRDQVAVMALTGCRPQEVINLKIERNGDGDLVFHILGAKTNDHKGQPWRRLTVKAVRPEFDYLAERVQDTGSLTLPMHEALADPADALCSAVRRAGVQALGKTAEFSAYVYRHAMAADLKADKVGREDIALILGHAVTETASMYGYWNGGTAAVRQVVAKAARQVKVNHLHGKAAAPPPTDSTPAPHLQQSPLPASSQSDLSQSVDYISHSKEELEPC
jgi:integrase